MHKFQNKPKLWCSFSSSSWHMKRLLIYITLKRTTIRNATWKGCFCPPSAKFFVTHWFSSLIVWSIPLLGLWPWELYVTGMSCPIKVVLLYRYHLSKYLNNKLFVLFGNSVALIWKEVETNKRHVGRTIPAAAHGQHTLSRQNVDLPWPDKERWPCLGSRLRGGLSRNAQKAFSNAWGRW